MAQTDVNTAFYRILAPTGMSEYFILPRGCPLTCSFGERVKFPDHLRHLSDVSPQLQVLAMGFSWALHFVKDGGELCTGTWFFGGRAAHGSSQGTCDDSGFDLFREFMLTVSVPWAVTARKFWLP